jgi:hypothetical protein
MTPINKLIVMIAVAALMIGTLVPASGQAYTEVTIIIGSDGNESQLWLEMWESCNKAFV